MACCRRWVGGAWSRQLRCSGSSELDTSSPHPPHHCPRRYPAPHPTSNTETSLLPLLTPQSSGFLHQLPRQLNFALNRIMFSNSASSAWTFSTWVASDDCVSCCCVWRVLSAGKLMMMTMLNVAGPVRVVRVDPGSEVVVKWEGERKSSAAGWVARSTQ
jgi:hypothetical protein